MSSTYNISSVEAIRRGPPGRCLKVSRHYHNCSCEAVVQCDLHGGRPYDGSAIRWNDYHEGFKRIEPGHYALLYINRREDRVDKCHDCTEHVKELLIATTALRDQPELAGGRRGVEFLLPDEDDDSSDQCVLQDATCPSCSVQSATLALCGNHSNSEGFIAACNINYKFFEYPITRHSHRIDQTMLKHVRLVRIDEKCEQCWGG